MRKMWPQLSVDMDSMIKAAREMMRRVKNNMITTWTRELLASSIWRTLARKTLAGKVTTSEAKSIMTIGGMMSMMMSSDLMTLSARRSTTWSSLSSTTLKRSNRV